MYKLTREDIIRYLENIKYPKLDKTLGDLGLVDEVEIYDENNSLKIKLSMVSDDSFKIVKPQIEEYFKKHFINILISKKDKDITVNKKNLAYGSTDKPNNRASFAKKVIAVTSGKGGVGKTTVAVNLAIGLAQQNYKVALLDADVYGPNVPRMTGTETEKLTWNDNNKIQPHFNFGIKMMSVAYTTPKNDTPLVWRGSVAVSAVVQFLEDVDWGELDFLIIDMPPGTGDIQLTMAQEIPLTAGIIVTTPQQVALDDVGRAIMMFKDVKVKIGGIIENMSYFITPDTGSKYYIFGENGGKNIAHKYSVPFLGEIPLRMDIRESGDSGFPPIVSKDLSLRTYYKDIVNNLLIEINK